MEPAVTLGAQPLYWPEIILGLILVVVLILLVVLLLRRPAPDKTDEVKATLLSLQSELQGRLSAMDEGHSARESALRQSLNERLDSVTHRVGQAVSMSQETQSQNLKDLGERLAVIDRAQKNIETLSGEVSGLQNLLSNKQARGAFGEKQMQDLIESYLPPSAYSFQATLSNGKRVDALIHMPGDAGDVPVDAKFPLEAWRKLDADPSDIIAARQFTTDVTKHIKDISERYVINGETHETALLFLPSEAIYAEIHGRFDKLVSLGFRHKVMIVSPTTFMATLHTMNAVMRDAAMRENADIILKEVTLLNDDIGRLDDRVAKLAKHFDQSVRDVRDIQTSTNKITRRADKIENIHLGDPDTTAKITELHPKRRDTGS